MPPWHSAGHNEHSDAARVFAGTASNTLTRTRLTAILSAFTVKARDEAEIVEYLPAGKVCIFCLTHDIVPAGQISHCEDPTEDWARPGWHGEQVRLPSLGL